MKSPHSCERTATVTLNGIHYFVEYGIEGWCSSDPGKTWGPPEDCYPPESESEVTRVTVNKVTHNEEGYPVTNLSDDIRVELKKLPLDDYLLENWLAGNPDDGRPEHDDES
jgi:hypothetical protein